jgi:hypothetical protein
MRPGLQIKKNKKKKKKKRIIMKATVKSKNPKEHF